RRQCKIEQFQYPVFPSPAHNPVAFHQPLDLTQVQVWLNRLAQQVAHAGGTSFRNFHEDALVAVRDHRLFSRTERAKVGSLFDESDCSDLRSTSRNYPALDTAISASLARSSIPVSHPLSAASRPRLGTRRVYRVAA